MTTPPEHRSASLWRNARWALAGVAAAGVMGLAVAVAVLEFGLFDVAASTAHLPEVTWFVHRVMIHSVRHRAHDILAPRSIAPAAVAAGFCEYHAHCQMCHGGPTVARDKWANGINPPPPYLIDARARWKSDELYWIVSNGVKMTAMPAWNASMSKPQIWSVVAFLETVPAIPPGTYRKWARAGSCPSAGDVIAALHADSSPKELPPALSAFRFAPGDKPRIVGVHRCRTARPAESLKTRTR